MSKELTPLEALEMVNLADVHIGEDATMPFYKTKQYRIIETALKALEIIKEKRVDVLDLYVCANYETYMSFFKKWNWNGEYDNFILTQEEYDLLKEVLL